MNRNFFIILILMISLVTTNSAVKKSELDEKQYRSLHWYWKMH